ncbi:MAG: adenylate/guanylate cyclase domain-containing protein [Proteobacteria bacterium]|nr:adenylate/guanylate cyclase domain-containing protein [Pseudomonadota bacterium]
MLATSKHIENGSLAGANPDITLPKPQETGRAGKSPAVLFADVSKSMLLHEKLGDKAARVVIDMLLGLAARAVNAHGGRVVKTLGDEVLAVLPDADAAAKAACDLLERVDACPAQGGVVPGMHIGFHAGAFIERDGDIFGDAVNIASRLTAYAKAGQILTTTASSGGISPIVRRSMRPLGMLDIRGKRDDMHVEEISWQHADSEDTTVTEGNLGTLHVASTRLVLSLGDKEWIAGPDAKHFSIGRDPCADVAIRSSQASRNHGYIEYRNGGFFYADTSLNGSYVSFNRSGESLIRRSQILLSGQGMICFGHSECEPGEPLRFRVESAEH